MNRRDLAVDLGTANTLVFSSEGGVVFNEPTLVAVNARTGRVLAAGRQAVAMLSRSPTEVMAVRPLSRGAITDFDVAQQMIRLVLAAVGVRKFPKPRLIVCVPSNLTAVQRRAVEEAFLMAGVKSAALVDEPLAAAVGAGLPIHEPIGNLVVDVGGGTSEMAVVAMGGLVLQRTVNIGGFDMDAAIQHYIRDRHGVSIGERTAERLKIHLGSAYPAAETRATEIQGREMTSGTPRSLTITPEEIREALTGVVAGIVQSTRQALADSPPELAQDVLETGLFLTGGGALLTGLDMRLAQECEVPVHVTEDPLRTVVSGAGHLLEYLPNYRAGFLAPAGGAR
ncbi:MAG: rod shape-determining protein [Actinomycetota bacterium]